MKTQSKLLKEIGITELPVKITKKQMISLLDIKDEFRFVSVSAKGLFTSLGHGVWEWDRWTQEYLTKPSLPVRSRSIQSWEGVEYSDPTECTRISLSYAMHIVLSEKTKFSRRVNQLLLAAELHLHETKDSKYQQLLQHSRSVVGTDFVGDFHRSGKSPDDYLKDLRIELTGTHKWFEEKMEKKVDFTQMWDFTGRCPKR